jgi:hypothetical protein
MANSLDPSKKADSNDSFDNLFTNCYIEITGSVQNQWKICFLKPFGDYRSTVAFWHLSLGSDASIQIYSKDKTDLLYEHQGKELLKILSFAGTYIPTLSDEDDQLHVDIRGRVSIIIPYGEEKTGNGLDENVYDAIDKATTQRFSNCYIEVEGHVHNDWVAFVKLPNMLQLAWFGTTQEDILFGAYSYILFEEDASIKIYDELGGKLIFAHDGTIDPLLTLIGFSGSYSFVDPPVELRTVTLSGTTLFTSIRLKDHGQ